MGLLELIPVTIGAGVLLKTTEMMFGEEGKKKKEEMESIHDMAIRKATEKSGEVL